MSSRARSKPQLPNETDASRNAPAPDTSHQLNFQLEMLRPEQLALKQALANARAVKLQAPAEGYQIKLRIVCISRQFQFRCSPYSSRLLSGIPSGKQDLGFEQSWALYSTAELDAAVERGRLESQGKAPMFVSASRPCLFLHLHLSCQSSCRRCSSSPPKLPTRLQTFTIPNMFPPRSSQVVIACSNKAPAVSTSACDARM